MRLELSKVIKKQLSMLLIMIMVVTTVMPAAVNAVSPNDRNLSSGSITDAVYTNMEGIRQLVQPRLPRSVGSLSWNVLTRMNRGYNAYMLATYDSPITKLSSDEKYLAFMTYAADDEHAAGRQAVYVQDRSKGVYQPVKTPDQTGTVIHFDMTPDARYFVYTYGEDIISGKIKVYLYDRVTDQLETITNVNGSSEFRFEDGDYVSISENGRYVVFDTEAKLAPLDTNEEKDVYLYDRMGTGNKLERISVPLEEQWNNDSWAPAISGEGQTIAFVSRAKLIENDAGIATDRVYLYDRGAGTGAVLKQVTQGKSPSISSDGRYLAFTTGRNDLIPGDTNNKDDIYVYDSKEKGFLRASLQEDGSEHANSSRYPSISRNGAYVAYEVKNDGILDPSDSYVTRIQDLTSKKIAVPNSSISLKAPSQRPTVGDTGGTITFFSSYIEKINDIEFPFRDYFVATNGTAPVWQPGSSLQATNIGKDHISLSWPEATDVNGVTGYALYKNGSPIAYIAASEARTYTVTNEYQSSNQNVLFQVEAINSRYHMSMNGPSYTWIRDGGDNPPPQEESLYFDWIGERSNVEGPLKQGGKVTLLAEGAPGRTAKAEWSYKEWVNDSQVVKTSSIQLRESTDAPGFYSESFYLTALSTELTDMKLTLSGDGKVKEEEADELPISVGGGLDITFTGATPSELQGSVLTVSQENAEEQTFILDGDELGIIDGLWADKDTTITLRTPDYRYEMGTLQDIQVQPGRTQSLSFPVTMPAQFRVKVVDSEGQPVSDVPITLWDSERQLLGTTTTMSDGTTNWREGLLRNQTVTVELELGDMYYELSHGSNLNFTLDKGDNEGIIRLISPDHGYLELTVKSPDNKPVFDAIVTATQTYKGKPIVTRGRTSLDGKVRFDLFVGEVALEATQYSYEYSSSLLITQVKPQSTVLMDIPMKQPDHYVINLNVFKKALDTEWIGPLNMSNENFMSTVSSKHGWVRTYFSNAVTLGGNPGEKVEVCITGTIYTYINTCNQVTMDENSNATAEVRLEEKGARIQGLVEMGRNIRYDAQIYEIKPNGSKQWVADAWDAHFQAAPFNINIPSGGTFRMEITKSVRDQNYKMHYEYANVEFTIEQNQVKNLGAISFNSTSYFNNQSGNYFTAQPARAIPGSTIVLKAFYRNNSDKTVKNARLELEIPEDMTLVSDKNGNKAVTGGKENVPVTVEGRTLHVPLDDLEQGSSGTVTYKLMVSTAFNKKSLSASARIHTQLSTEPETIGTVHLDTPKVTLDVPTKISDAGMRTEVSGYAPAGSTVNLYDTNVRIGGAVANASGIWKVSVTLVDLGNHSMHALWAETALNQVTLQSEKVYAMYDKNFPQLEKMVFSQAPDGRWITIEPEKNLPELPYSVYPGNPFLFDLQFTNPDELENVRVYMDGQEGESLLATREGDLFRATVPTTKDALGGIYVDYDVKNQPRTYDGSLPDLEQIRASMPLKMRDFEVVSMEPLALSDGKYTGAVVLRFPQLHSYKISYTLNIDPNSQYKPTEEEKELAKRSGVPAVQKMTDFTETDTAMNMKLRGYIPSNLLPQEQAGLRSAAAKEGDWEHTAEYYLDIEADVDEINDQLNEVKEQYDDYMEYAGKINKIMYNVEASGLDCLDEMPTTAKEAGKALAAVILGEVAKTAMSAGVGVMALSGPAGVAAGVVSDIVEDKIDNYVDEQIDAVGAGYNECKEDPDLDKKKHKGQKVASPKWIYDPSGFVYEAVKSNPLEGAVATVLYQDVNTGVWKVWDAEAYDQVNPQLTDAAGKYGWDVPPGKWKVVWKKDGYESLTSAELDVPPPHTEVNAGLISRTAPQISTVSGVTYEGGSYVDITFSKYLKVTNLSEGAVAITGAGNTLLKGTAEFIQVEESAANPSAMVSRTVRFTPKANLSRTGTYQVKLDNIFFTSYAGTMMLDKDAGSIVIPMRTLDIVGPTVVHARMESGGRMIRITYNEPIQPTADVSKFQLNGTADTVTSAVAVTKQGVAETRELLLTLRGPIINQSYLNLLPDAVQDKDGNTSKEGTLQLVSDSMPNLSELRVGSGTLSPAFDPTQYEYSLKLPKGSKELEVTAVTADPKAKLTIGSVPAVSGLMKPMSIPDDGIIHIGVELGGGTVTKTYSIRISDYIPDPNSPSTPTPPNVGGDEAVDLNNLGETADKVRKTALDGRRSLVVGISKETVANALKVGKQPKQLYVELKDSVDEIILQVPVEALQAMKSNQPILVVKTGLMNVQIDAAAALQQLDLAKGTMFQLVIAKAGDQLEAAAVRVAHQQNEALQMMSSAVVVSAEAIHSNNQASPILNALQGQYTVQESNAERSDVYQFDANSSAWIYVESMKNEKGKVLQFDLLSDDIYAVMSIGNRFEDMAGHWAQPDVDWMLRHLLVNGVTQTAFKPNSTVKRAEFAAILVRALGIPLSENLPQNHFSDVDTNAWYYEAVQKAVSKELIDGVDRERFAPEETITREQMAVMIGRAYRFLGFGSTSSGDSASLDPFIDSSSVQDWAKADVTLAIKEGFMMGVTAESFEPGGITTRAQAAVVLRRLLEHSARK
ncbi:S-layer homology domain-containing protein [Paenibacillus qinlingensis]|uniref:S-layer homology domain-containing protein n=1 Tax=Paenibacillus qinlingensis TaxID=1837343 RepID=UPI001563C48A|nr:S-layer homology domain-containing protein [Paenibacillus qinlingensis]NQX60564.1 S-layer homology domain-containing protein [Paenibacillus qinlingensis]